jgi:hypothetical protein
MPTLSSRAALALLALMLLAVPVAHAQCLGANIIVQGSRINLGGYNPGTADDQNDHCSPNTMITVWVRDIGNNPVPGISVILDFSQCGDLKLASTQSYMGETVNCQYSYAQNFSDALGYAHFAVRGIRVPGVAHGHNAVHVVVDGCQAGLIGAGTYDQDGANGVTLADLGLWAADYFAGLNPDRSDYDGNGYVGLGDLSDFATCYFSNCSSASGPTSCP